MIEEYRHFASPLAQKGKAYLNGAFWPQGASRLKYVSRISVTIFGDSEGILALAQISSSGTAAIRESAMTEDDIHMDVSRYQRGRTYPRHSEAPNRPPL